MVRTNSAILSNRDKTRINNYETFGCRPQGLHGLHHVTTSPATKHTLATSSPGVDIDINAYQA
jgi:hypothetical protein